MLERAVEDGLARRAALQVVLPGLKSLINGIRGWEVEERADRVVATALDVISWCATEPAGTPPSFRIYANTNDRVRDKDALDVLRLLQATVTTDLAERIDRLRAHVLSAAVTVEAVAQLQPLFGRVDAVGVEVAIRAAGLDAEPDTIAASMTALASDLLAVL